MDRDSMFMAMQHVLPKRLLTALAGHAASWQAGAATTWVIRRFIERYGVDMAEAAQPDPAAYPSFNAFFTRALKPGVRPLADAAFVMPVDGAVSELGAIEDGTLLQAKGHRYTAQSLCADADMARRYDGGRFITLYLSPRDYHRIHMPAAGRLRSMRHVPGSLYSVNPLTARRLPGLFARNERVVCEFDSDAGAFVLVLVGATIVGSIETVWHGKVTPPRRFFPQFWQYAATPVDFAQAAEMGRFQLGSTVIALFGRDAISFDEGLRPGAAVRMGQVLGHRPATN